MYFERSLTQNVDLFPKLSGVLSVFYSLSLPTKKDLQCLI